MFDRRERSASSALGYLEVVAALSRRLPQSSWTSLEPQLEGDWQDMTTALDFQETLASINEAVVLLASDAELLTSAKAAGLPVENPLRPANQL